MWLHDAVVGSFVIMRQEYGNCPFLPNFLKNDAGSYKGKIYVIGVITTKLIKTSPNEDMEIAQHRLREFNHLY